jgi:competence protein ComEC
MSKENVMLLDMLHLTHTHKDHLADIAALREKLKPVVLNIDIRAFPVTHLCGQSIAEQQTADTKNELIQKTVNDFYKAYADAEDVSLDSYPCNSDYNGGVTIKIDYPEYLNNEDPNLYSSLVSIEYCGFKILLTGDNNKEILKKRIENDNGRGEFVDFIKDHDVLLAPHHGRETDFCEDFFELVNPNITIVSDGKITQDSQEETSSKYRNDNRQGLCVNGCERKVLTTRKDGTIKVTVYGNGMYDIRTGIAVSSYGFSC